MSSRGDMLRESVISFSIISRVEFYKLHHRQLMPKMPNWLEEEKRASKFSKKWNIYLVTSTPFGWFFITVFLIFIQLLKFCTSLDFQSSSTSLNTKILTTS